MRPRVALLGCGRWGRNIGRCLNELGCLDAVSDATPSAAKILADTYETRNISIEDVLADDAVDAVAIATPAITHASVALSALRAGKHVFVEKPMATAVADALAVDKAARAAGKTFMVGHLLQYHPAFMELKAQVSSGVIGAIRYVYSNRLAFGRIRTEENSLWSFAPHDISMILTLMGEEPQSVHAVGGAYVQPTLADVTTTHMTFSGGRRAHVFVSWLHPYKEQKLVVIGEDGMLEFNDSQPMGRKLQIYRHQVDWSADMPNALAAQAEALAVPEGEPLSAEMAHFLDCVEKGTKPRTDAAEGVRVLKVLNQAQAALDRPLATISSTEQFV